MLDVTLGRIPVKRLDTSHSQRPVPSCFSLFKCCEWLVFNRFVSKRRPSVPLQLPIVPTHYAYPGIDFFIIMIQQVEVVQENLLLQDFQRLLKIR